MATSTIVMWETPRNNADLGLFHDSDFAGNLQDSTWTPGGTLCIFGSHTFVPTSWMCKKQASVSHSSTRSVVVTLDAGLRMDGTPALELWDLVIEVLHFSSKQVWRNPLRDNQTKFHTKRDDLKLVNVDYVSANAKSSRSGAMLYFCR